VLVGTGTASQPWTHDLHAAQIAAPLLDVLLRDLAGHAKSNPRRDLLPSQPRAPAAARISVAPLAASQTDTLASKGTGARERSPADEQLRTLSPN
jgi:penicillin-binding protein 1A